jgi:hypothetical protein
MDDIVNSEAGSRAYHVSVPLNQTSPTLTAVSMLNELSHRLGTDPTYEAIESKLNTRDWADDMGWKAAGAVLTRKRELDGLLSAVVDPREPQPDNVLAPLFKTPLDEGKKGVPFDTAQAAALNLSEVLQNVQFSVVQSPEDLREALNGINEARILRAQGLYQERHDGKPGVVWIIADNVIVRKGETPEGAVERVGFHEAAGHHGIRKVLGDRAKATFERVYEWAKTSKAAEVRALFTAVTSSEDYRDLSKAAQAEEILARLQESRQHKDLSFWERSMGAVCQMVGQHLPQMKFSAVECEYLLWQARVEAAREPDKKALFKSDMAAQVDFFKLQAEKLHIAVREASLDQIGEWSEMFRSQNPRFSASGKLLYSLPLTAPRQDVDFRPSEIPEWQAAASTGELFRVIRPGEDLPLSGFCRSQAAAVIDAAPVRFDDIEVTQVHAKESLNVLFQDLPWKTTSHEMWNIVERYGGPDTALGTMVLNAYQPSNNGLPDGYAVRAPSQNIGGRQMPGIPKIFDPNGDQVFAGELGQKPLDAVFAFASHNDLMGKEALKLNSDNLVVDELVGRDPAFVSEVRALGFDAVQVTDNWGKESRLNIVDRNAVDFATRTPSAEEITDSLLPEPAVEKNTFARKPVKLHGKDEEIEAFHSSAERSFALVAATHAAEKLGIMDEQQEAHFFDRLTRLAGNTLDYHDFTGRVVLGDHAEEIGKSFGAIAAHNAEGLAPTVQAIASDILSAKEKEGARSQLEGAGLTKSRITAIAAEAPDPWNEPDLPPSIFMAPPTPGCGPEM